MALGRKGQNVDKDNERKNITFKKSTFIYPVGGPKHHQPVGGRQDDHQEQDDQHLFTWWRRISTVRLTLNWA